MRVTTSIMHDTLQDCVAAAQTAEAAGYDGVQTMENSHDPFLPLAGAALNTHRIELATSIALAFPRSPMVVANVAHDLQTASKGRFVLGLGSQVKGHNIRRFSIPWSAPAPRLQEYVEALRHIWRCWEYDDPLDYRGDHYQFTLMPPNFKPAPSGLPLVPITIAAVGPAMLRVAGRCCDGVRLHPFCTRNYLQNVILPELATGMAQSGRSRQNFEITGGGFIATGADEDNVVRMFEFVRQRVAFYGSTRSYHPVLEQHGLEELGGKLHHMSKAGQWEKMPGEISDEVVRLFAAVGNHTVIAAEIEKTFGGLSDTLAETLALNDSPGFPPDLLQDIHAIPSPFTGFATVPAG